MWVMKGKGAMASDGGETSPLRSMTSLDGTQASITEGHTSTQTPATQVRRSTTETVADAIAALWRPPPVTTEHLVTTMNAAPQITMTQVTTIDSTVTTTGFLAAIVVAVIGDEFSVYGDHIIFYTTSNVKQPVLSRSGHVVRSTFRLAAFDVPPQLPQTKRIHCLSATITGIQPSPIIDITIQHLCSIVVGI